MLDSIAGIHEWADERESMCKVVLVTLQVYLNGQMKGNQCVKLCS